MQRRDDLEKMAARIVRNRAAYQARLLTVFAVAVIVALALMGFLLNRGQHAAACNVLEHRIASRDSDILEITNQKTILNALKALGEGAADPGDTRLNRAVERIDVTAIDVPEPLSTAEYERTCK